MVYIFGHKKPDTDSVTSAIALSYLKNHTGIKAEPRVLGKINDETKFVLDYFNIEAPKLLEDVKIKIKDIKYYRDCHSYINDSLYKVYNNMVEHNVTGMPILSNDNKFVGLITSKMIMNNMIKDNFDTIDTLYDNVVELLEGNALLRYDLKIKGEINKNIFVAENSAEFKNYIKSKPILLIVANGFELETNDIEFAKENKINIIKTNYSEFKVDKLLTLSNCCVLLKDKMRKNYFYEETYFEDFKEEAASLGHNNYPILSSKGKCLGLIRITDLDKPKKKRVILVDHNEEKQSVYGLEEAEILEIIDHHKINTLSTNMPINFRNMTVGSTNTIIYSLYIENGVVIPKNIAGIMLSGIISDTLMFTSPTTTNYDKYVGEKLSMISGINIESYSKEMFKAGTNLKGKTIDEILEQDTKTYDINDKKVYISQIITLNSDDIFLRKQEYIKKLNEIEEKSGFDIVLLSVTDVIKKGSYLLYNEASEKIISSAFSVKNIEEGIYMDEILSRKKQILPKLMDAIR